MNTEGGGDVLTGFMAKIREKVLLFLCTPPTPISIRYKVTSSMGVGFAGVSIRYIGFWL